MFSTLRLSTSASLALALAGIASAATTISSLPYTITTPGSYVLGSNLTLAASGTARSAIRVNASNVVLDLNGYGIGEASPTDTGILISKQTGVVVKNGHVTGFFMGLGMLNIQQDSGHRFENLRLLRNAKAMLLTGTGHVLANSTVVLPTDAFSEGVLLSSKASILENVSFVGTPGPGDYGGNNGIHIWGWNNRIRNCTFSGFQRAIHNDGWAPNATGNLVEASHFSNNVRILDYRGTGSIAFFNNFFVANTNPLPTSGVTVFGAATNQSF